MVHLIWVYVTLTLIIGGWLVPGPIMLIVGAVLFGPPTLFLMTYRCPTCGHKVYTLDTVKNAPGGMKRLTLYWFKECPNCHHALA